jgi:sporulation protein YlmC with PRC-barrel domain
MKNVLSTLALASAATLGAFSASGLITPVWAQVAGATTVSEATVTESTKLAMGWSVKKTLMGKTVYNEAGQKVGKVEDLIISPDRSVSYVIVGAGGFVGIGRHDVAIPVTQVRDLGGRLVMAGATPDTIKSLPAFTYASDSTRRDQFLEAAGKDIAKGRADAKAKLDVQITALQLDVKSAEARVAEMKQASTAKWRQHEADLNAATARLRQSTEKAEG